MARYFLDSSALVKRYHHESGSIQVQSLMNTAGNHYFISRLALVELHSTFARLVREKSVSAADFSILISRLEHDVVTGLLTVAAVSGRRLDEASSLLGTHGLSHNMRTLDAIHLATAVALHGRNAIAAFVAADKKLLSAASAACSLPVLDVT